MKRIASFEIDHTKLKPGLYISRIDGDITTYDIRMKSPNIEPPMDTGTIHAIEHIGATYLRNGSQSDKVIYFGPMGCRTGFYLLMRNEDNKDIINLIRDTFLYIKNFEGKIPGASETECGNYLDMNLEGAVKSAEKYLKVLEAYTEQMLTY